MHCAENAKICNCQKAALVNMTRGIGSKFKVRGTDSGKSPEKKFGPPCFSAAPHPSLGAQRTQGWAQICQRHSQKYHEHDRLTRCILYACGTISRSVCANEQLGLVYIGIHLITKRTRGMNLAILTSFFLQLLCLAWSSLAALCL